MPIEQASSLPPLAPLRKIQPSNYSRSNGRIPTTKEGPLAGNTPKIHYTTLHGSPTRNSEPSQKGRRATNLGGRGSLRLGIQAQSDCIFLSSVSAEALREPMWQGAHILHVAFRGMVKTYIPIPSSSNLTATFKKSQSINFLHLPLVFGHTHIHIHIHIPFVSLIHFLPYLSTSSSHPQR